MARYRFGGNIASWVFDTQDGSAAYGEGVLLLKIGPGKVVTGWSAKTGGTQYVNWLALDGAAISSVETDESGEIPEFDGPEDVTGMYVSADGGPRLWLSANNAPGPKGDPGEPGARGPGMPILKYDRATSTLPVRPALAEPHEWLAPIFPPPGGTGAVEGDYLRLEPS